MHAIDEGESESIEETPDKDEDLQAWCLLEESEQEQWQEVVNRRDTQKVKEANHASPLSVEDSQYLNSNKIMNVKDRWVEVRVTLVSGDAGHVMPEVMLPRVKLEGTTSLKRFVAANGEQIKDLAKRLVFSRQTSSSSEVETLWCCMKRIRILEILEMEQ